MTDELVAYTTASWKVWRVSWNSGTLDGTPTNWATVAFDDSGWAAPHDVAVGQSPAHTITTAEAFASTELSGLVWLARSQVFSLSAVPDGATLYVAHDDGIEVYVNGTLAYSNGSTSTAETTPRTLDETLFVAGTNVVAVKTTNGTSSNLWATNPTDFVLRVLLDYSSTSGVFIDWDNDGFPSGAYDNVTTDAMSWTIHRGGDAEITGGAQPGSCTLVLKNTSDQYNPANSSSPLYGKLRDGVPIWIGIADDGTFTGTGVNGLFGGRITDITVVPAGGASSSPTVEIVCEDMLGWASRTPVHLNYAEGRSQGAFRQAVLDAAGETRYSLDHEIETMPLSHADGDLLSVLSELNGVTGTRHYIEPADTFSDWYTYRTRNRFWRLDGTTDSDLSASSEHVTGTDGWRLSADTATNEQKATVQPIEFTPGTFTVWQRDPLPFSLTTRNPQTIWVEFDDVVRSPVLDIDATGASVVSALTPFATTAKVELSVASGTATINGLSIEGRLVRRPPQESYVADNATSQAAPRGIRAGSEIGGEYLGVIAEARGIAEHVVWRYADPQFRPTATVENWFPTMFQRDCYDVLSFTSSQLAETARHFEIVGLTHQGNVAADDVQHHVVTYTLQESKVQATTDWFLLDDDPGSLLDDGTSLMHY